MRNRFGLIVSCLCVLAVSGCMTPQERRDRRIEKHQAIFHAFPLDMQDKIRRGEVDIGFTEQMVSLALGRPRRVYLRKTADGETIIWCYVRTERHTESQWVTVSVPYKDAKGKKRTKTESVSVDTSSSCEYPVTLIEFRDGAATLIQLLQ